MAEITVLIVDDDESVAAFYETVLTAEYDVRTATSGAEALERADDTVDVVLLDRKMPTMSGDEVLTELRNQELDCWVAMLTAVEPKSDIVEMPFDDYEIKPVSKRDLLDLVEGLVARTAYDEQSQQFFALASKKAALEAAGPDDTDEYDRLVERLEETRETVDRTLDTIGVETAFRTIQEDEDR